MNIIFLVPENIENITGTNLTVSHYLNYFLERSDNVVVIRMPYHFNRTINSIVKRIKKLTDEEPYYIIGFTLNICYLMLRFLFNTNNRKARFLCFLIDSMTLNISSVIRHEHLGPQTINHVVRYFIYGYKETYCLRKCYKTVYVSPVDSAFVKRRFSRSIVGSVYSITNGIDIPEVFPSEIKKSTGFSIGFITGFSLETYQNNVLPFINDILPIIIKEMPDIRFVIAGRGANQTIVNDLSRRESIIYLGEVKDVFDFYNQVDVIVTSVKKECGIITRIMEAWAYKKVVIGFRRNFEAFEYAKNKEHYYAADNAQEFVNCLRFLKESPYAMLSIQEKAFDLVRKQYSWTTRGPRLLEIMKEPDGNTYGG